MNARTVSFSIIAILIVLSFLGSPQDSVAQETMPERLEPRPAFGQEYPFWVSARALDRGDGEIAWDLLSPGRRRSLSRLAQQNAEELRKNGSTGPGGSCPVAVMDALEDPSRGKSSESFDTLMQGSNAILRGKILEIDVGFVQGRMPASLLRIRVDSDLLLGSDFAVPQEIFVAYKQAAVTIGDWTYCSATGGGYDPKVGDQLIYFSFGVPCDTSGKLRIPYHRQLVFADRHGQLATRQRSLEESLRQNGKSTLDDLAEMVEEALENATNRGLGE